MAAWPRLSLHDAFLMKTAIVIGGGPAGLMAAEVLSAAGVQVDLYDAMPTVGRKFLLAGIGGLNLTHSEPMPGFASRYGARQAAVASWLQDFGPDETRVWAQSLGVASFVGSSGRVFPVGMKAAPLLRAWLHRLRHPAHGLAVRFHMRHRWTGAAAPHDLRRQLEFAAPNGLVYASADAVVLALGGASWPQLGSDGSWVEPLRARGAAINPLLAANCGFDVRGGWSAFFSERFAGAPFKSVAIRFVAHDGSVFARKGEFVATASGVEGSLVYALSAQLRDEVALRGSATFLVDLLPGMDAQAVLAHVVHPRGSRSLGSHLKSRLGLDGIKSAILHEVLESEVVADPRQLAASIKAVPITVIAPRPIAEAISSAGGVTLECMNSQLMVNTLPGVFCAGEMLDWEAPTGGYLLTACLASGRVAGLGAAAWLTQGKGEDRAIEAGKS